MKMVQRCIVIKELEEWFAHGVAGLAGRSSEEVVSL
jgi:hypothetical protein